MLQSEQQSLNPLQTSASHRVHGGADSYGVPQYDFSTNSNACGPCSIAHAAVKQADATQYPDDSYSALRHQLAQFHSVDVQRVLLAASASEFIFRVTSFVARRGGRTVSLPPHSYGDYAQAAHANGLAVTSQPIQPASAQLFWACEPSSPLGQAHAGLEALADGVPLDSIAVLDCAYEPLRLQGHASLERQPQKIWRLWTPNKALGLTGVRAAYAIAPPDQDDTAHALEQLCPSWPIGAHGVAMLQAWIEPAVQRWLADSLETLRNWKPRQIALCESLGWTCLPSDANFFCAQPGLPSGISLQTALERLRAQGIKLRDASSFGLPGHVRISVQLPAAQDALRDAWLQISKAKQ